MPTWLPTFEPDRHIKKKNMTWIWNSDSLQPNSTDNIYYISSYFWHQIHSHRWRIHKIFVPSLWNCATERNEGSLWITIGCSRSEGFRFMSPKNGYNCWLSTKKTPLWPEKGTSSMAIRKLIWKKRIILRNVGSVLEKGWNIF